MFIWEYSHEWTDVSLNHLIKSLPSNTKYIFTIRNPFSICNSYNERKKNKKDITRITTNYFNRIEQLKKLNHFSIHYETLCMAPSYITIFLDWLGYKGQEAFDFIQPVAKVIPLVRKLDPELKRIACEHNYMYRKYTLIRDINYRIKNTVRDFQILRKAFKGESVGSALSRHKRSLLLKALMKIAIIIPPIRRKWLQFDKEYEKVQ